MSASAGRRTATLHPARVRCWTTTKNVAPRQMESPNTIATT